MPCVHLGLHSAYVAVLRVPDSLGKEALDEVLSCGEVRYAERASDGAAANAFIFGLHALEPKIEGDVDLIDLQWQRCWRADDGREVILNGWVELTGESVTLAEGRAGSIDEVVASIGRDEARRHEPPQFRGLYGIPVLTLLCVRGLVLWGKGPADYHGDRSAHDMACCGRAAWYLVVVLHVGLSSREMVEVVATASRAYTRRSSWCLGESRARRTSRTSGLVRSTPRRSSETTPKAPPRYQKTADGPDPVTRVCGALTAETSFVLPVTGIRPSEELRSSHDEGRVGR